MFQRKRKQVLPVVGITVPQERYDEKVAECDELRRKMELLGQAKSRDIGSLEASVIEAANVIMQRDEQIATLTKELEMWKAKASHRKVKPKAEAPE